MYIERECSMELNSKENSSAYSAHLPPSLSHVETHKLLGGSSSTGSTDDSFTCAQFHSMLT